MKNKKILKKKWLAGILAGILILSVVPNPFLSAEEKNEEMEQEEIVKEDIDKEEEDESISDEENEETTEEVEKEEDEEEKNETDLEEGKDDTDDTEDAEATEENKEEIEEISLLDTIGEINIDSAADLYTFFERTDLSGDIEIVLHGDINLDRTVEINESAIDSISLKGVNNQIKITAPKKQRAFKVVEDIYEVFLNDLVFENGGIEALGSDVYANNVEFNNCQSDDNGGAILAGGQVKLIDSSFKNCSSAQNGGAIYNMKESAVSAERTTFNNCSAIGDGGAILAEEIDSVKNSEFTSCSARNGGAVYILKPENNSGFNEFKDNTFTTCKAVKSGGAISADYVELKSNTFTSCEAGEDGGAIKMRTDDNRNQGEGISGSGDTYTNCTAGNNGGAIWSDNEVSYYVEDKRATFSGCEATNGGAIYLHGQDIGGGTVTVHNVEFKNNKAREDGGAIFISTGHGLYQENTELYKNTAGKRGGGIFIENCVTFHMGHGSKTNLFEKNEVKALDGQPALEHGAGGALYIGNVHTSHIFNGQYEGNKVTANSGRGGALYAEFLGEPGTGTVSMGENTYFKNNQIIGKQGAGGAIAIGELGYMSNSGDEDDIFEFTNNQIIGGGKGGAIAVGMPYNIDPNAPLNSYAPPTSYTGLDVLFKNNSIIANSVSSNTEWKGAEGGAFYVKGDDREEVENAENIDSYISDSVFDGNYIEGNGAKGGALASITVGARADRSEFINNGIKGNDGKGGAIYSDDNYKNYEYDGRTLYYQGLDIRGSKFKENYVDMKNGLGGAVYFAHDENRGEALIEENIFEANKGYSGGAIYMPMNALKASKLKIDENTSFANQKAAYIEVITSEDTDLMNAHNNIKATKFTDDYTYGINNLDINNEEDIIEPDPGPNPTERYDYTVIHVAKDDGTELDRDEKSGKDGDYIESSTLQKKFDGYIYESASPEDFILTSNNQTVTLYYESDEDAEYEYRVVYINELGNEIATSKREKAKKDTEISYTDYKEDIKGYEFVEASPETLKISEDGLVMEIRYKAVEKEFLYMVRYINKENEQIAPTLTFKGIENAEKDHTEHILDIKGYEFIEANPKTLKLTKNGLVMELKYKAKEEEVSFRVEHRNEEGKLIAPVSSLKGIKDTVKDYKDYVLHLKGYEFVSAKPTTLTLSEADQVMVLTYKTTEKEIPYKVKHIDTETKKELIDTEEYVGIVGAEINLLTYEASIKDYKMIDPEIATYILEETEEEQVFTLEYKKDTDVEEPEIPEVPENRPEEPQRPGETPDEPQRPTPTPNPEELPTIDLDPDDIPEGHKVVEDDNGNLIVLDENDVPYGVIDLDKDKTPLGTVDLSDNPMLTMNPLVKMNPQTGEYEANYRNIVIGGLFLSGLGIAIYNKRKEA